MKNASEPLRYYAKGNNPVIKENISILIFIVGIWNKFIKIKNVMSNRRLKNYYLITRCKFRMTKGILYIMVVLHE